MDCRVKPGNEEQKSRFQIMNSKMPGLAGHFYTRNAGDTPSLHARTIKDRQSLAHHLLSRPGNDEQQALGKLSWEKSWG
jgi:hypothetical protein